MVELFKMIFHYVDGDNCAILSRHGERHIYYTQTAKVQLNQI